MEILYSKIKNTSKILAGALGCACLLFCSPTESKAQITPEDCDKFLGNIYSNSQYQDFTQYWDQVTPENAGKWGSVESTRDQMNWTNLDAAYDLAKDNGLPFRFHVLIWGNQQPSWLIDLPAEEQLEEIEEWFTAVAERYPDMDWIEVVNEPLNDPPVQNEEDIRLNRTDYGGYIDALGGSGDTGWDWVITSFRLAREYFPETPLMINEFNVTNTARNASNYVEIINLLKAEDLIDIVGIQGHSFETFYPTPAETKKNLNAIAATGLPIMVTEMDIEGVRDGADPSDDLQLAEYQEIFPIFWEHPSVMGVTLWGWRPNLWREKANLVTSNGTPRPAFTWLQEYMEGRGARFCDTPTTTPTGIEESRLQQDIKLYPNPATNGAFTLELTNERYDQVRVVDFSGKAIKTIDIKGQMVTQLTLGLDPGMYLVQLVNKQVAVSKKLLVK